MDEGGKQLGAVVVAIVVAIALIGLSTALFGNGTAGVVGEAITTQFENLATAAAAG